MTTPAPKTIEREKDKLWVTDAELIRAMGVMTYVLPKNATPLISLGDVVYLSATPLRLDVHR